MRVTKSLWLPGFLLWSLVFTPLCFGSVFTLGNSLTNDTVPKSLDGDVDWHIFCGRNLDYINSNPTRHCVNTSTPWPTVFDSQEPGYKAYDQVTVQPHFGTTLSQDADIISNWMTMQPTAEFIIHTGWDYEASFESSYHHQYSVRGDLTNELKHSPEYFEDLIAELKSRNPGRVIGSTHAIDILDSIYHDIQNDIGPFDNFSDLYRDVIHLNYLGNGQYLAHNAMRVALGQPISTTGFHNAGHSEMAYINSKLVEIVGAVAPITPGDFNNDGIVDAADYTVWRDNLGGDNSALHGNGDEMGGSLGVVDLADYNIWKTNFGNVLGGTAGALAVPTATNVGTVVPEPSTAALLTLFLGATLSLSIFRAF